MITDALLALFGIYFSRGLADKSREQNHCTFLSVREPVHACEFVCVCVNGKLKSLQLCLSWSMAFRLHVFGQHVEPRSRPLLTNTPAAVYHAGSGVEDSSLPVHMPSYQPTLSHSS